MSLDYGRNGIIFKNGWQKNSEVTIFKFIKRVEKLGVGEVVITDISRDGTLRGIYFRVF